LEKKQREENDSGQRAKKEGAVMSPRLSNAKEIQATGCQAEEKGKSEVWGGD